MMRRNTCYAMISAALVGLWSAWAQASILEFPDFSVTDDLTFNGTASVVGNALRLAEPGSFSTGSVFTTAVA